MSILSDRDIMGYLASGSLEIRDPYPEVIQPSSVDLHLGLGFKLIAQSRIDPGVDGPEVETDSFWVAEGSLWMLNPGRFVLGHTQEWIGIPHDLVGIVAGKSSLARIGLQVEAAGHVDPGWKGQLTLELFNMGPSMIVLRPGMKICQIRFEPLSSSTLHLYGDRVMGSHYQGSVGPVSARFSQLPREYPRPDRQDVPLIVEGNLGGIKPEPGQG